MKKTKLKLKPQVKKVLDVILALLIIVLFARVLLYIGEYNRSHGITNEKRIHRNWHIECEDENDMSTCLPVYDNMED